MYLSADWRALILLRQRHRNLTTWATSAWLRQQRTTTRPSLCSISTSSGLQQGQIWGAIVKDDTSTKEDWILSRDVGLCAITGSRTMTSCRCSRGCCDVTVWWLIEFVDGTNEQRERERERPFASWCNVAPWNYVKEYICWKKPYNLVDSLRRRLSHSTTTTRRLN